MSDTASALGFDAALFTESFATLRPLIRQEWPAVEEEALEATILQEEEAENQEKGPNFSHCLQQPLLQWSTVRG